MVMRTFSNHCQNSFHSKQMAIYHFTTRMIDKQPRNTMGFTLLATFSHSVDRLHALRCKTSKYSMYIILGFHM